MEEVCNADVVEESRATPSDGGEGPSSDQLRECRRAAGSGLMRQRLSDQDLRHQRRLAVASIQLFLPTPSATSGSELLISAQASWEAYRVSHRLVMSSELVLCTESHVPYDCIRLLWLQPRAC
ncbi:hypothetical protein BDW22DRAFT_874039 [Trametopsis cervina]|nr:hypothetical protein BDW22DRAFT_874039 [Trametopsis cervina]